MSSDNDSKIMTITTFRKELDRMITNVIATVGDIHNMYDIVAINREDLLRYIGQQIIPETYLVERNPTNVAAGLGPLFLKLAREIRDMIFERLLASGHPQFLGASKIMNKDGTSLISQHGVYRINIGFGCKANCPKLTRQAANTVQNLHLCVNMRDYSPFAFGTFPEKETLEMFSFQIFGNSDIPRKSCSVSFEARCSTEAMISIEVIYFMRSLKEFEEVRLSVDTDWFGANIFPDHLFDWQISAIRRARLMAFNFARGYLESDLGTAYRVEQKEGVQMIFYPRKSGQGKEKDTPINRNAGGKTWRTRKTV